MNGRAERTSSPETGCPVQLKTAMETGGIQLDLKSARASDGENTSVGGSLLNAVFTSIRVMNLAARGAPSETRIFYVIDVDGEGCASMEGKAVLVHNMDDDNALPRWESAVASVTRGLHSERVCRHFRNFF